MSVQRTSDPCPVDELFELDLRVPAVGLSSLRTGSPRIRISVCPEYLLPDGASSHSMLLTDAGSDL